MSEKNKFYNELSKITQKHEYTNEQLAKKIVANSCYPYEETIKNPHSNTFFRFNENMAEEITRIGCEKVREMQNECEKALERYDELSKIALKYKCTIIVPTQPNSERNYVVPQEFKDRHDVLVIDYFDKI